MGISTNSPPPTSHKRTNENLLRHTDNLSNSHISHDPNVSLHLNGVGNARPVIKTIYFDTESKMNALNRPIEGTHDKRFFLSAPNSGLINLKNCKTTAMAKVMNSVNKEEEVFDDKTFTKQILNKIEYISLDNSPNINSDADNEFVIQTKEKLETNSPIKCDLTHVCKTVGDGKTPLADNIFVNYHCNEIVMELKKENCAKEEINLSTKSTSSKNIVSDTENDGINQNNKEVLKTKEMLESSTAVKYDVIGVDKTNSDLKNELSDDKWHVDINTKECDGDSLSCRSVYPVTITNQINEPDCSNESDSDSDEYADDELTDNDDENDNINKICSNKIKGVKSKEPITINPSSEIDLLEFSNLKLKDDSDSVETVQPIMSRLKIASSFDESSDESDGNEQKLGFRSKAPKKFRVLPGKNAVHKLCDPYPPGLIQKVTAQPNNLNAVYVHPSGEISNDISNITFKDYERNFLKQISVQDMNYIIEKDNMEYTQKDLLENYCSPNTTIKTPLNSSSENYQPNAKANASSVDFNIPISNPVHSVNFDGVAPNSCSSDMFNNKFAVRNPSIIPAVNFSPDHIKSSDSSSLTTDDSSSVTQNLSVDDDLTNLSTSDYGSPSHSFVLSPASSVSPEHGNDPDFNISMNNHIVYTNTFNNNNNLSCNQKQILSSVSSSKMNIIGKEGTFNNNNNIQPGADNLTILKIVQPQLHNLSVSSVNEAKGNNTLPAVRTLEDWNKHLSNDHYKIVSAQNVQPKLNVVYPKSEVNKNSTVWVLNPIRHSTAISSESNFIMASNCVPESICNGSSKDPVKEKKGCKRVGQVKAFRPIVQLEGAQVYETEMKRSGHDRLLEVCDKKRNIMLIQWVTTLLETKNLNEQQKPLILINILNILASNFGDKPKTDEAQNLLPVWKERFLSTIEVVRHFLRQPDIYVQPDINGKTPLQIAAFDNYKKPIIARVIAECIVKAGLNVDVVDPEGNSILHLLCQKGQSHVHVLAELLNLKSNEKSVFDVNSRNSFHETPLHIAVNPKFRCWAVVKVLIAHHARVDVKNYFNSTPLHIALKEDFDLTILKTLLDSPSCHLAFDIEDNESNTPLMLAITNPISSEENLLAAVYLLSISGANNKQRSYEKSLIDLAPERRKAIKNILQWKKK